MRHDHVPSDLGEINERLRRSLAGGVDVDAVWRRISAAIEADVVVPMRRRSRRRTTALLLAATLALGGSALAGLGARIAADAPNPTAPAAAGPFDQGDPRGSRSLHHGGLAPERPERSGGELEAGGERDGSGGEQGVDADQDADEGEDAGSTDDEQGHDEDGSGGVDPGDDDDGSTADDEGDEG